MSDLDTTISLLDMILFVSKFVSMEQVPRYCTCVHLLTCVEIHRVPELVNRRNRMLGTFDVLFPIE